MIRHSAAVAAFVMLALSLLVSPASASAKTTLTAPSAVKMGSGFTLVGRGFKARALVTLRIGAPRSEAYFVTRVRANRAGTFRSVQRVHATGRWVWVAHAGSTRVTRSQRVRAGATLTSEPVHGVTAGTPFYLHITGFARRQLVRIQAKAPRAKGWKTVGSLRQGAGRSMFHVTADNPVFHANARTGEYQLRACSNVCRVAKPATRLALSSFRIGEP